MHAKYYYFLNICKQKKGEREDGIKKKTINLPAILFRYAQHAQALVSLTIGATHR